MAASAAADPIGVPFVRFLDMRGEWPEAVAAAGDVNGDGLQDVIFGARFAARSGAAYVVLGPFRRGSTIDLRHLGHRGFRIRGYGKSDVETGYSVAGAGDVNGDGLDDVLVGAPNFGGRAGRAYVVFGRRHPRTVKLNALRGRGIALRGRGYHTGFRDRFGFDVALLGDVDGDGLADVGVRAPGEGCGDCEEPPYFRPGSAYVIFGRPRSGSISMARLGHAGFRIGSVRSLNGLASAGDWNGDGRSDIAMMGDKGVAPSGPYGNTRAWIVYGRRYTHAIRLSRLGNRGVLVRGSTTGTFVGLAGGKDIDGDHRPDMVIGGTLDLPGAGHGVRVVHGGRSRKTVDLADPGRRAWEIAPAAAGYFPAVGFVNRDQFADIILSADTGVAVIYGARFGTVRHVPPLAPDEGFMVNMRGASRVAAAPDMNGDRRTDLLVLTGSDLGRDRAAVESVGYLIFSPRTGAARATERAGGGHSFGVLTDTAWLDRFGAGPAAQARAAR